MKMHDRAPDKLERLQMRRAQRMQAESGEKLRLVAVGPVDVSGALYEAILERGDIHSPIPLAQQELWMIADYRELWVIPKQEVLHAAIVHQALSSFELDEVCRFIRRQWPATKILVIRAGEDFLEDALYDDRVLPDVSPEELLAKVERLLELRRA